MSQSLSDEFLFAIYRYTIPSLVKWTTAWAPSEGNVTVTGKLTAFHLYPFYA